MFSESPRSQPRRCGYLVCALLTIPWIGADKPEREKNVAQPPAGAAKNVPALALQAPAGEDSAASEPSTYLTDPAVRRRLAEAERLTKEERLDQVLMLLQSVLDESDDSFIRNEDGSWIPAGRAAEKQIESLGATGIARYRAEREDQATHLLRQGVLSNDPRLWSEVMRRFFLTHAGFEATNLLASWQLDRGNPALALVYLDRLLESGVHREQVSDAMRAKRGVTQALLGRPREAEQTFQGIGHAPVQLGGSPWPTARLLDAVPAAIPDTRENGQWSVAGGNLRRSPQASGGAPLMFPDWSASVLEDSKSELASVLETVTDVTRSQRTVLDFGLMPAAWGQTVFYRNLQETRAVHLHTGQVLWTFRDGASIESAFQEAYPRFLPNGGAIPGLQTAFFANTIYGSLSTDGERVYQIDELVLNPHPYPIRTFGPQAAQEELPDRSRNRLTALNAATGQVVWTVGGKKETADRMLATTFFVGPPLPVGEELFVVGETRSELRLFSLDPGSGKLLWSQVIALCQRPIDADVYRQGQASFLAYQGGILLCPTNLARLVAIDPLTRCVLWHYPYSENNSSAMQQFAPMQFVQPPTNTFANDPPAVADGRIMLTSPQGNVIHCLDLQTGKPYWRTDRDGAKYLAGVFSGHVILVAADHVRSHRLKDGVREWKQKTTLPSGRSVAVDGTLFVPESDGALSELDLASGKLLERRFTRSREPIGNLMVQGSYVLASGFSGLQAFPMASEVTEEMHASLEKDPKDPAGLFRRAQISLTEGKLLPAVEDLKGTLASQGKGDVSSRARSLLFSIAEREALRDPGPMTPLIEEIGKLATEPYDKGVYYRLLAENCLARKDFQGALAAVDKQADLPLIESIADDSEQITRHPRVWTRHFVRRLAEAAGSEEATRIFTERDARAEIMAKQKDIGALEKLASSFAGLPTGDHAYQLLGNLLQTSGRFGEAEVTYLSIVGAAGKKVSAAAMAGAGSNAEGMKEPADALYYYRKLATAYPDLSASGGMNGKGVLEAFLTDAARSGETNKPAPELLFDSVDVKTIRNGRMESSRRVVFATEGELPYFSSRIFAFNHQSSALECYRQGSERREWNVTLTQSQAHSWPVRFESMGHLILFAIGDMVHGISAFDQKLLWSRRFNLGPGGMQPIILNSRFRTRERSGSICLTGPGFVAINTGKDLVLVNPWTGQDLWVRKGIEADPLIFGDSSFLFLATRDGSYVVHRTLDGEILRKGRFGAAYGNRKAVLGRDILSVAIEEGKLVARLWDPWSKRSHWTKSFAADTRHYLGDQDELLLLMKDGGAIVLDPRSGNTLLEDQVGKDTPGGIQSLQVFRDEKRFFLAIEQRPQGRNIWPMPSMPPNLVSCPINGSLRAYDRETRQLIWKKELTNLSAIVRPGANLPILICSGTQFVERGNNRAPVLNVQIIDKRDGKLLHQEKRDDLNPISELAYDLTERWVELGAWNSKIRIELQSKNPAAGEKK